LDSPEYKMRIKVMAYNNLCHELRHLQTLATRIDKKSNKFHAIMVGMIDELQELRMQLVDKVRSLDRRLADLDGEFTNCAECLNAQECDKK